ncbi:MAG: hypothetical protein QHC67_14270, partial [Sphingobium sp.]|nr:hypothetical protein [Sphingobium sp.]
ASAHSRSKPRWHNEIGDRHKTVTSPNILSAEVEEETDAARRDNARAADADAVSTPPVHAADRAQGERAAEGEQPTAPRDRDGRAEPARAPQVEDLTLVELRQAFHPGRGSDDMDMGI